jgi:hypothetical protein
MQFDHIERALKEQSMSRDKKGSEPYRAEKVVLQIGKEAEWIATGPGIFGGMMKCRSEEMARHIAQMMNIAHAAGARGARAQMREALGIETWGGDVRCRD